MRNEIKASIGADKENMPSIASMMNQSNRFEEGVSGRQNFLKFDRKSNVITTDEDKRTMSSAYLPTAIQTKQSFHSQTLSSQYRTQ